MIDSLENLIKAAQVFLRCMPSDQAFNITHLCLRIELQEHVIIIEESLEVLGDVLILGKPIK